VCIHSPRFESATQLCNSVVRLFDFFNNQWLSRFFKMFRIKEYVPSSILRRKSESVDSSYFRNIKELIVFMKEPAKNQNLESWIFQKN